MLKKDIQIIIAKVLTKQRSVTIYPEDVTFQMFIDFSKDYVVQHGYMPQKWKKELLRLEDSNIDKSRY